MNYFESFLKLVNKEISFRSYGEPVTYHTIESVNHSILNQQINLNTTDGKVLNVNPESIVQFTDEDDAIKYKTEADSIVIRYGEKLDVRGFEVCAKLDADKEFTFPMRGTTYSSGYDLHCAKDTVIMPRTVEKVPTGTTIYSQGDEELKLSLRSGSGLKLPIMLINPPGKIDSDYSGKEIQALVYNYGKEPVTIQKGERIVQGSFEKYLTADDDRIREEKRVGGFNSTGTH